MKIKFALLVFVFLAKECFASEFSGVWHFVSKCPEGDAIALVLKQKNDMVYGKWESYPFIEGTPKRVEFVGGQSGTLHGKVRAGKVAVSICRDNEEETCKNFPKYAHPAGYLELQGDVIRWAHSNVMDRDPMLNRTLELRRSSGSIEGKGCAKS